MPETTSEYVFEVTVVAASPEDAATVMRERIQPDEDYGFEYELWYNLLPISVDGEGDLDA